MDHLSPSHRSAVLERLNAILPARSLSDLAAHHGVTVEKEGRVNKGWVGITIERAANLQAGNRAKRDGEDFELKSTHVAWVGNRWEPQESIKVTQLNPQRILEEEFETSTLWNKLQRLIVVGCEYQSPREGRAVLIRGVDVDDPELRTAVQQFWEDVRYTVSTGEIVSVHNLGTSEDFIQLRPTGDGRLASTCPITGERFPARAFYLTKRFIRRILA